MTETPNYSVTRKENNIELRQYPPYLKAEVDVAASSYNKAVFKGFSILADFIFGNNIKKTKIAMTTPVAVSQSQKIAMTKPVTITGDGGTFTVAFIMPSEYTMETLPVPNVDSIRITSVPSQTLAAIRFSGFFQNAKIRRAEQTLRAWLTNEGLTSTGDVTVAGYNPPWVPGFLARSEVMVRVNQ